MSRIRVCIRKKKINRIYVARISQHSWRVRLEKNLSEKNGHAKPKSYSMGLVSFVAFLAYIQEFLTSEKVSCEFWWGSLEKFPWKKNARELRVLVRIAWEISVEKKDIDLHRLTDSEKNQKTATVLDFFNSQVATQVYSTSPRSLFFHFRVFASNPIMG